MTPRESIARLLRAEASFKEAKEKAAGQNISGAMVELAQGLEELSRYLMDQQQERWVLELAEAGDR